MTRQQLLEPVMRAHPSVRRQVARDALIEGIAQDLRQAAPSIFGGITARALAVVVVQGLENAEVEIASLLIGVEDQLDVDQGLFAPEGEDDGKQ